MVRRYFPAKSTARRDKDRRMTRVVELRAEGLSLRAIAARLVMSEGTVRNDLKRWDRERPNVTPILRNPGAQKCPNGGSSTQPGYAPVAQQDANVVSIRRSS